MNYYKDFTLTVEELVDGILVSIYDTNGNYCDSADSIFWAKYLIDKGLYDTEDKIVTITEYSYRGYHITEITDNDRIAYEVVDIVGCTCIDVCASIEAAKQSIDEAEDSCGDTGDNDKKLYAL